MRGIHKKTRRGTQRHWQLMLSTFTYDEIPLEGLKRFMRAFNASLPTTKRWAMSSDFQNNVNAALEREKNIQ